MTIEERADRAIYEPTDGHPLKACEEVAFARGYELGATEQKAIDEEVRLKKSDSMTQAEYDREVAFADWYHKNGKGTPTFSDAIEWAREETIIKVFDRLAASHVISELSVEGFKKAMEELV